MEAGFYGRVSGDSEESVDMQLALAREFAARDGYFIPDRNVYTDVRVSGAREDRPGFMRLEADVVGRVVGFDRLYVRDRQRFARWLNPRLFGFYIVLFERNGLIVRFCDVERHVDFKDGVTDADIGLFLMEQVENITNAKERTDIGRKMRRARRQHMINGAWPAGNWAFALDRVLVNVSTGEVECFVPWGQKLMRPGFRYELRFATDRRTEAIKLIFQRIEEGASLRAVATELAQRQLPPPSVPFKRKPPKRPPRWSAAAVSRIARNRIYTGTLAYGKWQHPDHWRTDDAALPTQDGTDLIIQRDRVPNPPISHEQFATVRGILEGHYFAWERRRTTSPKYLLTGMVRCAVCGRVLHGTAGLQSIYQHLPQYVDYECTEISKRIHGLDQLVLDAIREVALDPDLERLIQHELRGFQSDASARTEASIATLEEELGAANTKLGLREGDLEKLTERDARDRACKRVDEQTAEVARLKAQLATEHANRDSLAATASAESHLLRQHTVIRDILDSGDLTAKRILISNIAERISARPSTREVEIALRYN